MLKLDALENESYIGKLVSRTRLLEDAIAMGINVSMDDLSAEEFLAMRELANARAELDRERKTD